MAWDGETPYRIQCFTCERWISSDEANISLKGLMPYMTNYEYTCRDCGQESLIKKAASFIQIGITALANLTAAATGDQCEPPTKTFFDVEREIVPFVWKYWDNICTKRRRSGNWKANLSNKLNTESIIFSEEDGLYSLVDQDLSTIGPRRKYESKTVPNKVSTRLKRKAEATLQPVAAKKSKRDLQPSIRKFFPVRRSTRKCKSVLEEEKFQTIKERLLSKNEDGLKVEEIEGKGRGVKATRRFARGELVCQYYGKLITYEEAKKKEGEYSKDEKIGCYMYYFEYKSKKMCIDATDPKINRLGRLINHSKKDSNIKTKQVEIDGLPYLCLFAARDIREGEELKYDYGEHSKEAINSHPWLKN